MRTLNLHTFLTAALLVACGGSAYDEGGADYSPNNTVGGNNAFNSDTNGTTFEPETEEFLLRTVAATQRYVFVPNRAATGTTVARIDGRDLSVTPIPVGLNPTDVVAFENDAGQTLAAVLVEGTNNVAIIRADLPADDPADLVHLLRVPGEVNALAAAGDGRHVLAYIDPDRPLPADASVASLQSAALIRIGAQASEDAAYDLSVTRLVRDVEFVADGSQLFLAGREGVNRLMLDAIDADTFVPPLALQLSDGIFPPTDLEMEVAADASFMVLRSSAFAGVSIHPLTASAVEPPTVLPLPGIPTDIDLYVDGPRRLVLATVRDTANLAVIDVDAALAEAEYVPELIAVDGAAAGLAQLTPDLTAALLYSTLPLLPSLSVFDLATAQVRSYPLRNAIRSVAIAPDSRTAVVVHDVRPEAETFFQSHEGLTLFDLATGYRRPITLQARPVETVLTPPDAERGFLFTLLESTAAERQGVLRVDLQTYRTDFVPLARAPRQIGLVAGKLFVAQEAEQGRITFIDIESLTQRTVSGYELNAGID